MKILVTGASGGLGELTIQALLKKNIEVIATSRNRQKAESASFFNEVKYIPYDITTSSGENLYEFFGRPDGVIHLAWDKLNEYKNTEHTGSILEHHKMFLSNLLDNGLKDLTCVGTCYEYGLKEGELKETDPSSPVLPYPEGKDLLRQFIEAKRSQMSFAFKWIRVFYVFGEVKERKNLYTHLMTAIKNGDRSFNMSGGEQVRDFLSPAQISARIGAIAMQKEVQGIINCCSGTPVKLKEFVKDFLRSQNYEMDLNLGFFPYADYEPMVTWGSTEKLKRALGENKFEN